MVRDKVSDSHHFLDFNVPINVGLPSYEIIDFLHHLLILGTKTYSINHDDILKSLKNYYFGDPEYIRLLNGASEEINIIRLHIIKQMALIITPNYELWIDASRRVYRQTIFTLIQHDETDHSLTMDDIIEYTTQ